MPRPGKQYDRCPVLQCGRKVEYKAWFRNPRTRTESNARFCRKHVLPKNWPGKAWGELIRFEVLPGVMSRGRGRIADV